MCSVNLNDNDPIWTTDNMTLQVNVSGHVLHAFVNGKHIGMCIKKIFSHIINEIFILRTRS